MRHMYFITIFLLYSGLIHPQKNNPNSKHIQSKQNIESAFQIKTGFMVIPTIKIDGFADNGYGYSQNLTLFGIVGFKRNELLFGPTKIMIPENKFNDNSSDVNDRNIGVYLGYRYQFERRKSRKFNTHFQYLLLLAQAEYEEYSLGLGAHKVSTVLFEHTIGFGTNYEVNRNINAFASLNLGINLCSGNLGFSYQLYQSMD